MVCTPTYINKSVREKQKDYLGTGRIFLKYLIRQKGNPGSKHGDYNYEA
jgi:hypothetical protein